MPEDFYNYYTKNMETYKKEFEFIINEIDTLIFNTFKEMYLIGKQDYHFKIKMPEIFSTIDYHKSENILNIIEKEYKTKRYDLLLSSFSFSDENNKARTRPKNFNYEYFVILKTDFK